jgi:hypothetical protein
VPTRDSPHSNKAGVGRQSAIGDQLVPGISFSREPSESVGSRRQSLRRGGKVVRNRSNVDLVAPSSDVRVAT